MSNTAFSNLDMLVILMMTYNLEPLKWVTFWVTFLCVMDETTSIPSEAIEVSPPKFGAERHFSRGEATHPLHP